MNSPSGFYRNGKWYDSTPPQSEPSPKGRNKFVSKTRKTGVKEAIKAAFKKGKTTLVEIRDEILDNHNIDLGIESIRQIRVEMGIGKRYQKKSERLTIPTKTCNSKRRREDKL